MTTSSATPRKVLVVEDDNLIRGNLTGLFNDEGYDVREAENGRTALDALEQWAADVIVLDLMMPVMDGWSFLRERRDRQHIPVIVISAAQDLRGVENDPSVTAVLPKPFDLDDLLNAVERAATQA